MSFLISGSNVSIFCTLKQRTSLTVVLVINSAKKCEAKSDGDNSRRSLATELTWSRKSVSLLNGVSNPSGSLAPLDVFNLIQLHGFFPFMKTSFVGSTLGDFHVKTVYIKIYIIFSIWTYMHIILLKKSLTT